MNKVLEALARRAVIGHRGYPLRRPENTIASFLEAIGAGADIVEMDVHKTKDDVLAVVHDPELKTPDGVLKVREVVWADLSGYRVGGERIPTLEEALSAIDGRAGVFIEIKDVEASALVREAIRSTGATSWAAVISFHKEALVGLKGLVPLGLIYARPPGEILEARRLGLDMVLPQYRLATAKAVSFAHRADLKVAVWTVNDASLMEELWRRGVDAIASDDVELAVSVRNKLRS
ncbi:MAG: glycerophosphodiester phosphodiesterase [Thermoproteus sp.]